MDLFKQGMKSPSRSAPPVPGVGITRYSPVTNWDDNLFDADVFEPNPQYMQKKKPPPRPPPPKLQSKQSDVPAKPSHFLRKPTILSSLMSKKNRTSNPNSSTQPNPTTDFLTSVGSDRDTNRMFPKCEPKNVQTGALIDLSSPPSSPTFTTRSSSDGLSVDSFGSDATTSTNHHHNNNGGNASQAESGFEDDFDLFLNTRKTLTRDDTFDNFAASDPFSPQPVSNKPPILRKPVLIKDPFDLSTNQVSSQLPVPLLKGPTIIRAKPVRPKPPDNSALLKNTFGNSLPVTSMNINTTTPIQKVNNGFGEQYDNLKALSWDDNSSPEREDSPPMPLIPPPPPPPDCEEPSEDIAFAWPKDAELLGDSPSSASEVSTDEEPYAVALFDYQTDHSDDLCFSVNTKITLVRRVDQEWLYGRLRNGAEGHFPSNYVEIKVALPNDTANTPILGKAVAMYNFEPVQPGDLKLVVGDTVTLRHKLSDEWYFGECNGGKGQFPINYVQLC